MSRLALDDARRRVEDSMYLPARYTTEVRVDLPPGPPLAPEVEAALRAWLQASIDRITAQVLGTLPPISECPAKPQGSARSVLGDLGT